MSTRGRHRKRRPDARPLLERATAGLQDRVLPLGDPRVTTALIGVLVILMGR